MKKHAWDTWRKPAGEEGRLWLKDDLPKSLPEARIFLYEYGSRIFSGKYETFLDAGNELLDSLRGKRRTVRSPGLDSLADPSVSLLTALRTPAAH